MADKSYATVTDEEIDAAIAEVEIEETLAAGQGLLRGTMRALIDQAKSSGKFDDDQTKWLETWVKNNA